VSGDPRDGIERHWRASIARGERCFPNREPSHYDIKVPSGKYTVQRVGTVVVDSAKTKQLGQLLFQGP